MTLRLEPVAAAEAPAALRAEWEALAAETEADPCFAPDWVETWWAHFGPGRFRGRRPLLLAVREGEMLVALLPFCLETVLAGLVPVRVARLAGADPGYAVMRLPILAGREVEVLGLALSYLLDAEGRHAVSLSPLSELAPEAAALERALEVDPDLVLAPPGPERRHTVMHLPETFDAWFASLSKSRRREYTKDAKRLAERFDVSSRSSGPEDAGVRFEAFAELHAAQWEATGRSGHFGDWPGSRDFYAALVRRLAPSGRASIDEHAADGRVLSAQLRFRQGRSVCWRLIGRSLDPEFAAYGLGRVGLVERVRDLIALGVRRVEAGTGDYDYKLAYGGELVPLRRALVMRPWSRGQGWLLIGWADLLNLVYYRAWFLKAAPRVAARTGRRRPLWTAWIRTRL